MKAHLIEIHNDVYDIARRVKEIDTGYFVVRNVIKRRFEVHHGEQRGDSLAVVVPYPELDARTVRLVKETRREYAENVLREIERQERRRDDPRGGPAGGRI